MSWINTKTSIKQAMRFGVVGALNTLVDYGLFYIFISMINLHKSAAQVLATAAAMCCSFFLNRRWTFEKGGRGSTLEIIKFLIVNLVSMVTVIVLTHLFYDIWHVERLLNGALRAVGSTVTVQGDGAIMVCKVLASVFSLLINFFGNKLWVFSGKN